MPKATHIVQRRTRRQQQKSAANSRLLRLGALLVLLPGLLLSTALLGGVTAATAVAAAFSRDLPDYDTLIRQHTERLAAAEPTIIYASGPENVAGRAGAVVIHQVSSPAAAQPWLSLDSLPPFVADAIVAANEPDFWADAGFLTRSRALLRSQTPESAAGPIVQQLAQIHFTTPNTAVPAAPTLSYYRHTVEQLLLARQIETTYTKEQILEWYLNTGYYGNLAIGIDAAAHAYFNKPAANLTLAEAAMLAALPRQTAVNPLHDYPAAAAQQAAVLTAMSELAMISPETARTTSLLPTAVAPRAGIQPDTIAPHFALVVTDELVRRFGPERVLRGGLHVTTTLDLAQQQQAECLLRAHLNRLHGRSGPALPADELARCPALTYLPPSDAAPGSINAAAANAAVVLLDSQTGQIKALVGGRSYWDETTGPADQATAQRHPPGAALHPLIYLTALSQGYSAATMVLDVETDFAEQPPFAPQNQDGRFHGPMRLRVAAGSNFVVPAAQVLSWIGTNKLIDAAHSMGVTRVTRGNDPLADPLGGDGVSLLDMTVAFSVMNNMGVMIGQPRPGADQQPTLRALDPVTILRVVDSSGALLYEHAQPERREILTPQLAYLMNDILSDRSARCPGYGCPNALELPDGRPAAAVAGSSSDLVHAWTVGHTPQWVAGVWVGGAGAPLPPAEAAAAPIWRALMAWLHENEAVAAWQRPANLIEQPVCNISGLLPTPACATVSELFIPGTEPTLPDTMHREVAVNRETGRLATIYTPPELVENRVYVVYPEAAQQWARDNNVPQPPAEYDSIVSAAAAANGSALTSPQPFAVVRGRVTVRGAVQSDDFDSYRLAYFAGLQPANIQTIVDDVTQPPQDGVLGVWDTAGLDGLHTLLLTVIGADGRFHEVTTHVTIDNTPPQVAIVSPLPDAQITPAAAWITVQAQAGDDVGVAEVAFYANDAVQPFAVSRDGRFTARWPIPAPGCHDVRAVARDLAGNEAETTVVFCIAAPE